MERPVIYWHPEPNESDADLAFEAMLNGPLPPEAYKDPDELAAEQFLASVQGLDIPEPPEMPAFTLAA